MRKSNLEIFRDTMNACDFRCYYFGDKRVNMKLTHEEMTDALVFLPEEVANLKYTNAPDVQRGEGSCIYDCQNLDSFDMARKRRAEGVEKILVLNLANPVNPGGGVRNGANAQEEDLCRKSSLLLSLEGPKALPYYKYNRSLDTYMGTHGIVITPKVEIIKDSDGEPLEESVVVSVMTCAAPMITYGIEGMTHDEYKKMVYDRISGMLYCAASLGYRNLVLGAFGCGAFKNDAFIVSNLFFEAFKDFEYNGMTEKDAFDRVDFAVRSKAEDGYNITNFRRNFANNVFREKLQRVAPEEYVFFWHENESNGYLSNWYHRTFTVDGVEYAHVEQYIMAQKAKLFGDTASFEQIIQCDSPSQCKAFGRGVVGFNSEKWDAEKYRILKEGVYAKFSQNPDLAWKLSQTEEMVIAEASPSDAIYGIGHYADDAAMTSPENWRGQNLLGKALMEVRDVLKNA